MYNRNFRRVGEDGFGTIVQVLETFLRSTLDEVDGARDRVSYWNMKWKVGIGDVRSCVLSKSIC